MLVIFLACSAAIFGLHFFSSLQGTDFPDFYCAARMLLDGHGRQLYDAALQYQYQAEYAGRVGTLYIHPPFEAVLYLAVAWLPLRYAYAMWSFLNLLFLSIAARTLAQTAPAAWDWQILPTFALIFVPLLLCLIQGQDSIVLLLLVVLAYADLRRGRTFSAGCWLGLALFKFHLVLTMVIVLLLAPTGIRKRALASGFATVALALIALSAAISGWSVFSVYPKFLINLPTQRFPGIIPHAMPNFRGLTFTVFHRDRSPWAVAMVFVLSAVALVGTLNVWKRLRIALNRSADAADAFDLAFSTTMLFSLLVSYHLNPHDLTLLLLPISLTLYHMPAKRQSSPANKKSSFSDWTISDWTTGALLMILFLPPLHLLALKANLYPYALIAIPLILLFAAFTFTLRKNRPFEIALHADHS